MAMRKFINCNLSNSIRKGDNMKHNKIRRKFILYLDGELPETEKRKIDKHLSICASCRDALNAVMELWKSEESSQVLPPESLWYELKERREGKRTDRILGLRLNKKMILNTAAMIIVVIFSILSGSRLGTALNPSFENENKITLKNTITRDDFGINYFDILPPNSIAEDVFIFASNTEVNKK